MSKALPHAQMGFGTVRHMRLRPQRHAFDYPTFFLMLPMRHIHLPECTGGLPINRAGAVSFFDADHGDGRGPQSGGALAWLLEVLQREGVDDADGEIWLHTYPRMLGYTFKPVSFWHCHRSDGRLRAIVVEVNNTFGERHCYLLGSAQYGQELHADKCFHVSPFCRVEGRYRFRFMRTPASAAHPLGRTVARVDHDDDSGPLIQTSVSGQLQTITADLLRAVLWRYPAMTLMVMLRIHWQAWRLWRKRVAFFGKPKPPDAFVSR